MNNIVDTSISHFIFDMGFELVILLAFAGIAGVL
jgi:hypothetical protein